MYEQINKDQFEGIMEDLSGNPVWLEVRTKTVSVDVFYEEFEFISFINGKYQFGFEGYDEENEYRRLMINQSDILKIHRNIYAPDIGAEQIVLYMKDGVKMSVEYNY